MPAALRVTAIIQATAPAKSRAMRILGMGLLASTLVAIAFMVRAGMDQSLYFRTWPGEAPWMALGVTATLMSLESAIAFFGFASRRPFSRPVRLAIALATLGLMTAYLIASAMHAPRYHFIHFYWSLILFVAVSGALLFSIAVRISESLKRR